LWQRVLISWKPFHHILKQVHYSFVYVQLLLQANPTGYLLEIQLLRDMLGDRCHLLQKLSKLLIRAVGG
jgi:hypothetical protein